MQLHLQKISASLAEAYQVCKQDQNLEV